MNSRTSALSRDDDFDRYLDETFPVVVAGVTVSASDALFCKPTAYAEALRQWSAQRIADLRERAIWEYPFPIAVRFNRSSQGVAFTRRIEHLRDTWQAIITVVAAICLAEVRHRGIQASTFGIDPRRLPFHNIRDSIDVISKLQSCCGEQLGLFEDSSPQRRIELVELMGVLNHERNGLAHVEALHENEAAERFKRCEPQVLRILTLLPALGVGDLASVADVGTLHFHRGIQPEPQTRSSALTEVQHLELFGRPGRPSKRDLFWLYRGNAFRLSPLIRRTDAEDCQQFRIFYLDDVKPSEDRLVYQAYGFITRCDTSDGAPGHYTREVIADREVLLRDYEELRTLFRIDPAENTRVQSRRSGRATVGSTSCGRASN